LLTSAFVTPVHAQSHEAFLQQVGGFNVATILQFSSQSSSYVSLSQTGDRNQARIEQTDGSRATITQNGDGNLLAGLDALRGFDDVVSGALQFDSSQLVLSQFGTDNRVFLEQAAGSRAQITQNGTGNTVTLIQGNGALQ
jgi:hypothetical protein